MPEGHLSQALSVRYLILEGRELESPGVVGVENEEESGEAVADEHRPVLLVGLGLLDFEPRLVEREFSARIGQDNQIVVRGLFFKFDLAIFVQLVLLDMLGALHFRKLLEEGLHMFTGARQKVIEFLGWRRHSNSRPNENQTREMN